MSVIARLALVIGGSVLYLGLAVIGWGGVGAVFAEAARVALVAVLLALAVASWFAGGNVSPGVREDRDNRWVIGVLVIIGLIDGWLPAWTERIAFWTLGGDAGSCVG